MSDFSADLRTMPPHEWGPAAVASQGEDRSAVAGEGSTQFLSLFKALPPGARRPARHSEAAPPKLLILAPSVVAAAGPQPAVRLVDGTAVSNNAHCRERKRSTRSFQSAAAGENSPPRGVAV